MSRILVLFGTTNGQTEKIAHALETRFSAGGHQPYVFNAALADPNPALYDAVIVAASVHAGGYQREVVSWVKKHAPVLNEKTTAFVSVCLGILQKKAKVDRDLQAIIDAFLKKTVWRPVTTYRVAGALKYTQYNAVLRWLMKRIAAKAGGATDTTHDYEYTDWAALERFADAFGERVKTSADLQLLGLAC